MSTFEDREKAYESKFAHDQELLFKIKAKRNKMLGIWAADILGLESGEANDYSRELVETMVDKSKANAIIERIANDFEEAGVDVSHQEIVNKMEDFFEAARQEVYGD